MIDHKNIHLAVRNKLLELDGISIPDSRAWENVPFDPTTAEAYIKEEYLPGGMEQITLGTKAVLEVEPSYVANVYAPANAGLGMAANYADAIIQYFAPGTQVTVIGDSGTNIQEEDDLDKWGKVGSPTITSGVSDPLGGTDAYTVADTSAVERQYIGEAVDFTTTGKKAASFEIKEGTMPASGVQTFGIYDNDAAVWRSKMDISAWVSGEPTITANTGVLLEKYQYGTSGWWKVIPETTSALDHTNANVVSIQPIPPGVGTTGAINVFRVRVYEPDTAQVRRDLAPFRGQMLASNAVPGFVRIPVTIPLRMRTANSI